MTTESTRWDTEAAGEIRPKLAELRERLSEAQDAERVTAEAVEASRARHALTGENRAESGLDAAQKRYAAAQDDRLGIDAAIARLERGLELAQAAEHSAAQRRWAHRAQAERKAAQADRDRVVRMLGQVSAALVSEDARLVARAAEIKDLGYQAAADGATWHVGAARPLSQDHRAFKTVLEHLSYLAAVRAQN